MDLLTEILAPARPTAIVDAGANPIDGDPPYKAMLAAGLCDVTGFEPQAEALARLEKARGPRERYLPYVLGDGSARTLNLCELEGMTSLLVPDPAHLALFNLFPIWGTVKSQIPVTTRKLDDIAEIAHLDFLKMDVQGAEREVLAHGRAKLAETVVIQTEVSFVPLYKDQPVFGEMDLALRELGFLPHSVIGTKIWPIAPMVVGDVPNRGIRQLLETELMLKNISIRGARAHNLKNIDVEIPRDTLTVLTGLSGSGKSSLAFDTIYAEGQRRYVESLSAYARQFL